ncbi:MAG: hypothetical protein K2W96_27205 [Gemmataceae bacterium]|nr:hypothetical protein [Gemmataceae bacterium]
MVFVVDREGGMSEADDREYILLVNRMLSKSGADFADAPRVKDGPEGRWLYAWEDEAAAEAFAAALRKQAKDKAWKVRRSEEQPSRGPMRPLEIAASRQDNDWTFGLETFTKIALQRRYPDSCPNSTVTIRSAIRGRLVDAVSDLKRLGGMVLLMLTGLDVEQLESFGSFQIIEPVKQAVRWGPTPLSLNGRSPATRTSRPESLAG